MAVLSKSKAAVFWIMAAPPGETRTQQQAADKFGIEQPVVSRAVKRYVDSRLRPDARRGRRK